MNKINTPTTSQEDMKNFKAEDILYFTSRSSQPNLNIKNDEMKGRNS